MNCNELRVKDLKTILEGLPDDMLVIIPVVDENDVNDILAFRKVRTVGILEHYFENDRDRKALCLNGACGDVDIAEQARITERDDIAALTVLYAHSKYEGPVVEPVI